ncbi:alpha/beta hydrolase [Aquitalea sp. LB_tupeE]|uniref:alpha/beta hydrolase n=1 Tax=Aquitalea sp. LB_tupeE TaxID=2748078 RepID=UPI0015BA0935|nr:alpha/beta hydrolase [Aquitalea sp. LB_tupeE]NWK76490.1 alpha/beta hydrolase [Aquitalea sp. LB_tupeE]
MQLTRKAFMQSALLACTALFISALPAQAASSSTSSGETMLQLTQEWDKTFPQSSKVDHRKVSFRNRYGILLAADLYLPKNRGQQQLAALAVSGPFGAVKEQSSGLYAQAMAERGFVTLAFDPSYTGESGGEPRNVSSPEINTEDFSAAVDYLGLLPEVNREKIGLIGICGFGGMSLNAAAVDKRIKAVVTTSMYDMSRVMAKGLGDSLSAQDRSKILDLLSQQRWQDAEHGHPTAGSHGIYIAADGKAVMPARVLPETLPANPNPVMQEFFDYYRTPRGFHKNSVNSSGAFTATSALSFMNMPLLSYIKEIAPRPILLIAGENAHSRYFSEDIYQAAAEPKELLILKNTSHVDLYDRMDKIPFDRITRFFQQNLH